MRVRVVSAEEIDRILDRAFTPRLLAMGFNKVSRRKWHRNRVDEIRDLVIVQPLKGGSYSPIIGFSLDYVPHISGQSVRWHRTEKSSLFDLRFDPLDREYPNTDGFDQWIVNGLFGAKVAKRDAKRVVGLVAYKVIKVFDKVKTQKELSEVFESQAAKSFVRFGFNNYIQQPLAYAFTLLRLGEFEKSQVMIKRWAEIGNKDTNGEKAIMEIYNQELKEFSRIFSDA